MNTPEHKHPVAAKLTRKQRLESARDHLAYRKMLLLAHEATALAEHLHAARRVGDFMLEAQRQRGAYGR